MKTDSIKPGTRLLVFDYSLYKDDKTTPLTVTMKPATVVCRYGKRTSEIIYDDLVDVRFDHDGRISKGHFTDMTQILKA